MKENCLPLLDAFGVSRETMEKLKLYEHLLRKWQPKMNLVSNSTLDDVWVRHFADSLQLVPLAPYAKVWVDLGSGAGFPGLPIAIHLASKQTGMVHLIESDHRKCAFLREATRVTSAAVHIHHGMIESIVPTLLNVDVVTARAVASLNKLLELSGSLIKKGATGLFLKGQDVVSELTRYPIDSRFDIKLTACQTGSSGYVVRTRCAVGYQAE